MKNHLSLLQFLFYFGIVTFLVACKKQEIEVTTNSNSPIIPVDTIHKSSGIITSLLIDDAILIGQVTVNQEVVNTELQLHYSGGNGLGYKAQELFSSNVQGLKLQLPAGFFSTQRTGVLKFKVVGKTSSVGLAAFPIEIGGQSGVIKIHINDGTQPTSGYGPNFKDVDGNIYRSVYIGNQLWQAENLRTTKYDDGNIIPNVEDQQTWFKNFSNNSSDPMLSIYNNDQSLKPQLGVLYNWYVIDTTANGNRRICPQGWRVPTDNDWRILEEYLGGPERAGGKMKEVGSLNWVNPNTSATNESLFSALPSGYRLYNGNFSYKGNYGFYWSSTENGTSHAYFRYLFNENARIIKNSIYKSSGFSIRCIKG